MLTDPSFWDDYWKHTDAREDVDIRRNSYDRCFHRIFRRWLKADSNYKLFELGCAPGRWLIYFHRQYSYSVAGCDSAPEAISFTRANLARANVPGEVMIADFMDGSLPTAGYDVVLSLGVVEHFADPQQAIAQHVRLVKPGGTLVLEVPNYRGLNGWFLKHSSSQLLAIHNLDVMRLTFFREIASRFVLIPRFIGYIGGYEPALWDAGAHSSPMRLAIGMLCRLRRWMPFLDSVNHPLFSGYLIGIYQKPTWTTGR